MKKLNLQLGSIKEMLTKEQMKKVAGGGYDYSCSVYCPADGSTIKYDGYCDLFEYDQGGNHYDCIIGTYYELICCPPTSA